MIHIYMGENRLLIVPVVHCREAEMSFTVSSLEDKENITEAIVKSREYIIDEAKKNVSDNDSSRIPTWKNNSKYKNRKSFVKNNNLASILFYEDRIEVESLMKSEEFIGQYGQIYKEIVLKKDCNCEEITDAVIYVLKEIDNYYLKKPPQKRGDSEIFVSLINSRLLKVNIPKDKDFVDNSDYSVAEIYKCYDYIGNDYESNKEKALFFLGIAPELDCDLSINNISKIWQKIHGKAESFSVNEGQHGIFELCAEMINSDVYIKSYFLQIEDDLLLECGMYVEKPYFKKELVEKLISEFDEFANSCQLC